MCLPPVLWILCAKPGAGSLIAVSCVLSALDAAIIAATGSQDTGLPFCAVSALSISGALWSSLLMCKGNRITLRTLALSRDPFVVTAEAGVADKEITLIRSKTGSDNFVRRTEEITPDEIVYLTMAPWLLIGAFVLAVAAAFLSHDFKDFAHILAAILCLLLRYPRCSVSRSLFRCVPKNFSFRFRHRRLVGNL